MPTFAVKGAPMTRQKSFGKTGKVRRISWYIATQKETQTWQISYRKQP